jgi:voltage-gated potassium channel Kch
MSNKQPIQPRVWPLIVIGVSILTIGTIFYHFVEKLKFLDAFYFSTITLTTVGYGDITPQTDIGKIFTVFYVLIGIGLIAGIANYVIRHSLVKRLENYQEKHNNQPKKH